MSKVKIQGNASGTGVLTVTAPNTSTDRTITLPDSTGTLATTGDTVPSGVIAMWHGASNAIPSGWVICDGNNSTPNLTDKFIKSTGTGTDQTLQTGFTGGANVISQNNTLTTSWQKFTHTTSSVLASTVNQIAVQFTHSPAGTAGAADYYEITGVQLEVGDTATDFEHRSYGEELALCQRYFHQQGRQGSDGYEQFVNIAAFSTTGARCAYPLPTTMRAFPSVTSNGSFQTITGLDITAIALADSGGNPSVGLNFAVSSGYTVSYAYTVRSKNDADAYLQFDAEL